MTYLKEFLSTIRRKDYQSFLKLWEEYCAGDELDGLEAALILKATKESEFADMFGRQVERLLPLWSQAPETPESIEVLRLIFDLETSNTPELAALALQYIDKHYGSDPLLQQKLKLVGLRSRDQFQGALRNFELINHLKKGKFVLHLAGWGVGEVTDASFLREQVSIEFELLTSGKKDLSFHQAFKTLVALDDDHFLARRFGNPDELEQLAKKDPVAVIRMLLRDLGPKTAAEIKDELCDLVIPSAEWVRWWQSARAKMKKDTMIDSPGETKGRFSLRRSEVSHGEKLRSSLEGKESVSELVSLIYPFLRDFAEDAKEPSLRAHMVQLLKQALKESPPDSATELEALFLLQDLGEKEALTDQKIQELENPVEVLRGISIQVFKKRFLVEAKRVRPDADQLFLTLLFQVDATFLRDYIFSELLSKGLTSELKKQLEQLINHPERSPEGFLWYFQRVFTGSAKEQKELPLGGQGDSAGRAHLFESLFILLSRLETDPTKRELAKKIHTLLSQGRYALIRQLLKESSIDVAKELLLLATKCHSLSDHDIKILHSLAEVVHPSLAKLGKRKEETSTEEETIWTTQEGYNKLQRRIQQIATIETVENAREIEVARSHGDLRENSEFKFALEKRDRLQAELKSLSEQLKHARVLTPHDVVVTDGVGIGTVVECEAAGKPPISLILLGPWDADPENNILSYQSKIAKEIAGLKEGEQFSMQGTPYTIRKISNYFQG